jgi:hypothetical protein
LAGIAPAREPVWVAQGAAPNTNGQVEGIKDREVSGAVNAVLPHPANADELYIGSVNGGIWKTTNATGPAPSWKQLTDDQQSLSIGALEFDPTDANHQTLVAGIGRFSSLENKGGARAGLLRTANGGTSWTAIKAGGPAGALNIRGVAPRGNVLVVAANDADSSSDVGVWRSDDTGGTWKQVSGAAGTGLPAGPVSALAFDPTDNGRLFCNAGSGASASLYRSNDTGANWARVGNAATDARIAAAANLKIAVGPGHVIYVAVVDGASGQLSEVFRSPDGGASWATMGVPTLPGGVGIHPGRQGGVHLSLAADAQDPNIVYIGGDRQDGQFREDPTQSIPNSIGARDYSGCLFRGDASKPAGSQWVHLTHSNTMGATGGGTKSGSAPHADSRTMRVAADGSLIEGDDGGVFRRSGPRTNTGDWFSLNGNLQVAEFHAVAWDPVAKTVVGGAQDTGTPEQLTRNRTRWRSVSTGDGGVVAVDGTSAPGFSYRYTSYYDLGSFRRQVYDASNDLKREDPVTLTVGGNGAVVPQFYTPIRLSAVDPTRLVVGAGDAVYESADRGDTAAPLNPRITVNGNGPNPIAYGAKGNPDALYVGSFDQVYVRRTAGGPLAASGTYAGGYVYGITMDPERSETAFVVGQNGVYQTKDAGGSWADLTGDLASRGAGTLRSVAYCTNTPAGALMVGTDTGVFSAPGPAFNIWSSAGAGLPRAPVYSLEYAAADNLLLAGTLGRGAWTLSFGAATDTVARAATGHQPPQGAAAARPPQAPDASNVKSFNLRPGVVVDPGRKLLYAMAPEGGIEALKLETGEVAWATKDAARPVGLVGGRLIAQAAPEATANALKVVSLDPGAGKAIATGSVSLPADVRPMVQSTARREFSLTAAPVTSGGAVLNWRFSERRGRALPPGTKSVLPASGGAGAPAAASESKHGAFKLDLDNGATTPHEAGPAAAAPVAPAAAEHIAGLPLPQLLSADGRNVLVKTAPKADKDPAALEYTLEVYDRATAKKLGAFQSHYAGVPFFVTDSRVVFETPSYRRADADKKLVEEPARLHAVDLQSGNEIWSRPVLEAVSRGAAVPP